MLFLSLLALGSAGGKTIYVDWTNSADPSQDGTAAHPFDTIQEAVYSAYVSDDIVIANGTYSESVEVNQSVTITGNGSVTVQPGSSDHGFDITKEYVTISDVSVEGAKHGVHIQNKDHIDITRLDVGNCTIGIWVLSSNHITVFGTMSMFNDEDGIYLELSDNCTIRGGDYSDNGQHGINFEESIDNTLRDLQASDNTENGIHLVGNSESNTIRYSTLVGNARNVNIRGSDDQLIRGCDLTYGDDASLFIYNSRQVDIWDSQTFPGNVTVTVLSELDVYNTTIWGPDVGSDSELIISNWVVVRIVTAPPTSFGISDADVQAVDHWDTSNDTIYATEHFGGNDDTTDLDGWSERILVLTREYDGTDLTIHNYTFDIHYYGWTNSTLDGDVTMGGVHQGKGMNSILVNASTEVAFEYPLVVYYGDLNINSVVNWTSLSVIVFGNLTINPTGYLTLTNTQLWIASNFTSTNHIEVQGAGTLAILDGDSDAGTMNDASVISPLGNGTFSGLPVDIDPNLRFWARSNSVLIARNSILAGLGTEGDAFGDKGLLVETDDVTFVDMNFSYCRVGIYLNLVDDVQIVRCTFYSCDIGILAEWSTDVGIVDSTMLEDGTGIEAVETTNLTITGSAFNDVGTGVIVTNSSVSMDMTEFDGTGTGLNVTGSRTLYVINTTFMNGGSFAWIVGEDPSPFETSFVNISLVSSGRGIHAEGSVRVEGSGLDIDNCDVGLELSTLNRRPVIHDITIEGSLNGNGIVMMNLLSGNITNLTLISLMDGVNLDNCSKMIFENVDSTGCYRAFHTVGGGTLTIMNASLDLDGVLGSKGIVTDGTSDVFLSSIHMIDGDTGISMTGGTTAALTGINTTGTTNGLFVSGTDGLEVKDSGFTGGDIGVSVAGSDSVLTELHVSEMEDAVMIGGTDTTVRQCTISDFGTGVEVSGSGHRIAYNNITGGNVGIGLERLSGTQVYGNTIEECSRSIQLADSYDNVVYKNSIEKDDSDYALYFGQNGLYNYINRSNRVNGEKIYFYFDHRWSVPSSLNIDSPRISNVGQVAFVNCSIDIVFQYSNITGGDTGLFLVNSANLHIFDTEFSENDVGIRIDNCSDIEINYTSVWRSNKGIAIDGSNRIVLGANGTLRKCGRGIEIFDSVSVRISDAIRIEDSTTGIYAFNAAKLRFEGTSTQRVWVRGADTGIWLVACTGTIFEQGAVKGSTTGVLLDECSDTELGSFELIECDVGISAEGGSVLMTAVNDAPTFESCGIGLSLTDPDGVEIENAMFTSCTSGVDLNGGTDVLISKCDFVSSGIALVATRANGLMLMDSRIEGSGDGFLIKDSSGVSVNGTTRIGGSNLLKFVRVNSSFVSDTLIENAVGGIVLDDTTDINLSGITIKFTSTSQIGAPYTGDIAFHLIDSVNIMIADVTIDRYDSGIHVSGGGAVVVMDSTISSAGYRGISTEDTDALLTRITMTDCEIGVHSFMSDLTITDANFSVGGIAVSGDTTEITGYGISIADHASSGLWMEGTLSDMYDLTITRSVLGIAAADGTTLVLGNAMVNNNTEGIQVSFSTLNMTSSTIDNNRVGIETVNSTVGIINVTLKNLETDIESINSTVSLIHVSILSSGITGISADASSVYARDLTAMDLGGGIETEGGDLVLRDVMLRAVGTAVDTAKTSVDIDGCTFEGGDTGLAASGGTLKAIQSVFENSGTGVHLQGGEVKTFRYNSITGCGVGLHTSSPILPHIVGLGFSDNEMDLKMFDSGVVTVTDTSFENWKLEDTSVDVRNYLKVRIISQSTGYGMGTGEVRIWDDGGGGDIYATPYFNGTNATTAKSGYTDQVLARSATYTSSGVTYFTTGVELRMPGWDLKDYGVNMNVSHTEIYTYGMITFQTIRYVEGRNQTGLIGTKLNMEVAVQDDEMDGLEGIAVAWMVVFPNGSDAKISPMEGLSDANGTVRCNVTLPTTPTNLTVIAYLKLDPIKNVTFEIIVQGIEFDLDISTSGTIYIGDEVVFEVVTELEGAQFYLDFGDGSNSGWTNDTYFTHSYKVGTFNPSLRIMTNTGLVSAAATDEVRVREPEIQFQKEEAKETPATQFIVPLFVLVVIIMILAVKVMVPDLGKGLMKKRPRSKKGKKDIEFMEGETFMLTPDEQAKKKPAETAPKKGGETLEDLIIGLEKHKKAGDDKGKKRSFLSREEPKKSDPVKRPAARAPKKGAKGGKK